MQNSAAARPARTESRKKTGFGVALALTGALGRLLGSLRAGKLFESPPEFSFRSTLTHCPHCAAALKVLKTYDREPCTLHLGKFVAHVSVLHCPRCPGNPAFHSEELAALVGPHCRFGHDVMVHAGEAALRRCLTADETVAELRARNVEISESEVGDLVAQFVVRLGIAHAEAAPRIREHLRTAGGYILHLDSTCKGGSAHLLTGIDELSGFVLLNAKVPSESALLVGAFLRDVVARFGPPVAVSCDMSAGILAAIAAQLRHTPVFICHFHFLRDLGKDLMAGDYAVIRNRLRHHGLKAELRRMQRELRDTVRADAGALEELLRRVGGGSADDEAEVPHRALLGGFVTSILEAECEGDGCGFPFDRPHLLFLRQAQTALRAVEALRIHAPMQPPERKLYGRLADALRPTCSDRALNRAADALEAKAKVFDRLRVAMRIAQPRAGKGLNDDGDDAPIATIERDVGSFVHDLREDRELMLRDEYHALLAQIDKYGEKLFADPIQVQTPSGVRIIQPQRTNNILERFFRRLSRQGCKRTGQRPTARSIDNMLPDAPLVANLDNPDYVELLLDGCENLAHRLACVDRKLVHATLEDLRRPRTGLKRSVRAAFRERPKALEIAAFILRETG